MLTIKPTPQASFSNFGSYKDFILLLFFQSFKSKLTWIIILSISNVASNEYSLLT